MQHTTEGAAKTARARAAHLDNLTTYAVGSKRSAESILRIVLPLVQPSSIVDVGCSNGAWLAVARRLGVHDTLGIDGAYVDPTSLLIPADCFRAIDLTRPFLLPRRYDLVISVEVAEHLPAACADDFVQSLTALGPVVLFSAAIPFQGGTGHINERWPDYWAELFAREQYVPVDCIRYRVWSDPTVDVWYAQNCMLYVDSNMLGKNVALTEECERTRSHPLSIVHPHLYLGAADPSNIDPRTLSLTQCFRGIGYQTKQLLRRSLHWRLQRLIFGA